MSYCQRQPTEHYSPVVFACCKWCKREVEEWEGTELTFKTKEEMTPGLSLVVYAFQFVAVLSHGGKCFKVSCVL